MQFLVKDEKIKQMRIACTYIASFYAQMFFQSMLAAKAPGYNLDALKPSMHFAKIPE